MKFKKPLLIGLSFVLVAAVAIGGTFAYLTSKDSDVNVMTLGNVSIVQHEYERVVGTDGNYVTKSIDNQNSYVLQEFTQGKSLLPIVGDPSLPGDNPGYAGYDTVPVRMSQVDSYGGMDVFAGKNAQDKFVTIENTGKTDAYVRTLVAIEIGSGNANLIGTSYHMTWIKNLIGTIVIDNNNYYVIEYLYKGASIRHENGILPAGDTSYPNLSQVYIKSAATNEDCEALDGNGNGTLDILVLSQAAQVAGFDDAQTALDTAFGKSVEKAAEWFGGEGFEFPAVVDNSAALAEALENGETVILNADLTKTPDITAPYGNKTAYIMNGGLLNGNGNTLDMGEPDSGDNYGIMTTGGTIKNISIQNSDRAIAIMYPTEDIIVDNVVIKDNVLYPINTMEAGAQGVDLIVTNSTLGGWTSFSNIDSASFTDCSFVQGTYYTDIYGRVLKPFVNTTLTKCAFDKAYNLDLSGLAAGCTVTIQNCTVNGQALTAGMCTVNPTDYDNCNFSIDLPSGRTLADCVIFK